MKTAQAIWDEMPPAVAQLICATIGTAFRMAESEPPTCLVLNQLCRQFIEQARATENDECDADLTAAEKVQMMRELWVWALEMTAKHGTEKR